MDLRAAFGRAVRLKRVELDLSQEALADKAKMGRAFLSGVERGKVKVSIDSIESLAGALGCQPSDLFVEAQRLMDKEVPG